MHSTAPEVTVISFLRRLRARGPWVLSACVPDGGLLTRTLETDTKVTQFVRAYNGTRNVYYSVNPTKGAVSKKATKSDIGRIEWIFGDLDPAADETPEAAKQRYLKALEALRPTAAVDSGNGLQVLYRLEAPVAPTEAAIADVEARTKALMQRLGAKPGTQNVDRILRLPGTINLPNAAKRKAGRVKCTTELMWFEDRSYGLDDFPPAPKTERSRRTPAPKERAAAGGEEDELERTIRVGEGHGASRSEAVWWTVNEMLRRGFAPERVAATLLDRRNGLSAHVFDQAQPQDYARRQVSKVLHGLEFVYRTDKKGKPTQEPLASVDNVRVGLLRLGVRLRYDQFADRVLIEGLPEFGPALEDAAVTRLWLTLSRRFKLEVSKDLLYTVILDTARLNGFHPVREYLDGLKWDGVKRLDTWLIHYAGSPNTEYTRAVGSLLLIAAVRRVRQPGCKFDELVTFEDSVQGSSKSTALEVLATRSEWFADDLPLNVSGKEMIELLRGKWIIEVAELSGLRRAEVQHIKAMLSRRFDRGRLAYDRLTSEVPRQSVLVATTNDSEYLRDTTGNRRFWPIPTPGFDVEALKANVDQLWAEAAVREASGESIRLPERLWPIAAKEQNRRLTRDPYAESLAHHLGNRRGKVTSEDVWTVLDIRPGARGQDQSRRMADAMRSMGWQRANSGGTIRTARGLVSGWVKGEQPWVQIFVTRDKDRVSIQGGNEDEVV